ncbi:MAG: D-alanyl-D-alanine carboxypeptidase family protein, partial [Propionibacteriaceae bacterium]
MSFPVPFPTATHRRRLNRWATVSAVLMILGVSGAAAVGYDVFQARSAPSSSPPHVASTSAAMSASQASTSVPLTPTRPAGTSVFDTNVESVAKLDSGLLDALSRAATDAARDDVSFSVSSGWRSTAEQERLFREAVTEHGSEAEAARWVSRPGTSAHESGRAVDLGPSAATTWLARHGAR